MIKDIYELMNAISTNEQCININVVKAERSINYVKKKGYRKMLLQ